MFMIFMSWKTKQAKKKFFSKLKNFFVQNFNFFFFSKTLKKIFFFQNFKIFFFSKLKKFFFSQLKNFFFLKLNNFFFQN